MDPPWYETGGGKIKRGADRHYDLVKTPDLPRSFGRRHLADGCAGLQVQDQRGLDKRRSQGFGSILQNAA